MFNKDEGAIFILGHSYADNRLFIVDDASSHYGTVKPIFTGFEPMPDNDKININYNFILNGFSVLKFLHDPDVSATLKIGTEFLDDIILNPEVKINTGSIVVSSYYDVPKSPDLSVNLGWEYGGSSHQTAFKGGSISNTMWTKPPMWGFSDADPSSNGFTSSIYKDIPPWELTHPQSTVYSIPIDDYKSGRRVWSLSFSYIQGSDLWGSNQSLNNVLVTGSAINSSDVITIDNSESFKDNLLTDNNFFSQVWHRTLGGTIPFIFQPDNTNFNPDQFAICRIKDNSLSADQVAPGVYNISLDIEEMW